MNLTNVEGWVSQELNGYTGELPAYRKTRGRPTVWTPFHGWQPIGGGDVEFLKALSEVHLSDSLASIEAALNEKTGKGSIHMPYSPHQLGVLSTAVNRNVARAGVDFPKGTLAHILDAVRNLVLDWVIELEKKGVLKAILPVGFR